MFDIQAMLKDGSITKVLQNAGRVVSMINPAIGAGIIMASNVTDAIDNLDDDTLENGIIGLDGTAKIIDDMIYNKNVDFEKLHMLSHNLKSMSVYIQKSAKLVK